jgi:hypothetical protein
LRLLAVLFEFFLKKNERNAPVDSFFPDVESDVSNAAFATVEPLFAR